MTFGFALDARGEASWLGLMGLEGEGKAVNESSQPAVLTFDRGECLPPRVSDPGVEWLRETELADTCSASVGERPFLADCAPRCFGVTGDGGDVAVP